MKRFAVIDTETTWADEVMSIGIAVSDFGGLGLIAQKYYVLTPFKSHGGMFAHALYARGIKPDLECPRGEAISNIKAFLEEHNVDLMFAYNALFDYRHLPELQYLKWFDIMKIAAYRQFNSKIPANAECFATGRLKRGYGVEDVYRMLSGNGRYAELHNALADAMDELEIMRMLGVGLESYNSAELCCV